MPHIDITSVIFNVLILLSGDFQRTVLKTRGIRVLICTFACFRTQCVEICSESPF